MQGGKQSAGAPPRAATTIAAGAALLLAAIALVYLRVQNVWIDESTQLSGSRLPFGVMLGWLEGRGPALGVPGDRMPPLGYAIDWGCAHSLCGAGERGFRLLHLAAAAAGLFGVTRLAARRHGAIAGAVAGLVLALLPQVAMAAIEVRAYPFFLALTCAQLLLLYRLCDADGLAVGRLATFALLGLAAVYTHFFGLISTSALFVGLAAARVRSGVAAARVGVAWAAVLLLSAGLAPFVGGARTVSDAAQSATGLRAVASYLAHVLGSAPMLYVPALGALALAGLVVLALIAAVALLRPFRWPAPLDGAGAVLAALVAGLGATILASFAVHGFDPLKPSYSIWMLPPVALLAGRAAAAGRIGAIVAGVTLAALAGVTALFVAHAGLFVHGPERAIAAAIGPRAEDTALVHRGAGWPFGYYPLVYRYGGRLDQYRVDEGGALRPIGFGGDPSHPPVPAAVLGRYRRLLFAAIETRSAADLRHAEPAAAPPPAPPGWRITENITIPGLYRLQLTRLERMP